MITLYENVFQNISQKTLDIFDYFDKIKTGFWQDEIFKFRNGKLKKEYIPCVTISGIFESERKANKINKHSGIICIDIDSKENPEIINKRDEIFTDVFLFAAHISVSGNGLALYFRIDKRKHLESFLAIEKYLGNKYNIICDPSCKDVSRLRFVSYDPEIHINNKAEKWTTYIDKKTSIPNDFKPIFDDSDFDFVISQIRNRAVDLTSDYHTWLSLGFSIASEYGERGRDAFQLISSFHPEYSFDKTNKKYDNIIKSGSRKYTIKTFFWVAKNHGLEIKTRKTQIIENVAISRKKQIGKNGGFIDANEAKESTKKYLSEVEKINDADKVIDIIFDSNVEIKESNSIDIIIEYVKSLDLKYNVITQRTEFKGEFITDRHLNSIFLDAKQTFPKDKFNKDMFIAIIESDRIKKYNPFLEFIENNKHLKPKGNIIKLLDCIVMSGNHDYVVFCGTIIEKWLLSIIASIHGTYSLLILVLIGDQMTNKTNFFRNLLPNELKDYFAESKLDRDKDDEILMSQKLILCDDEFAGKSKKEAGKLKELSSKQTITARKSYGRYSEDLNRIAVLCGTSNEKDIINDPTGNRRILPIEISYIDFEKYKKIDKTELFIELYHKWQKIGNDWMLTKNEVEKLNNFTQNYSEISLEEDLITRLFELPNSNQYAEFMTTTEMLTYCETYLNKQKLYHKKFGQILRKLGFVRIQKRGVGYGFLVIKKTV